MADHMRTELVTAALDMAARNYPLAERAIFHSDRGTQYTSEEFAKHAKKLGLRRSVGRTGACYDNAQAETFNS
ncbi:MAG: DDE-type integrase/transposase/recombinase, partial [Kineosporiaceae bacterium]